MTELEKHLKKQLKEAHAEIVDLNGEIIRLRREVIEFGRNVVKIEDHLYLLDEFNRVVIERNKIRETAIRGLKSAINAALSTGLLDKGDLNEALDALAEILGDRESENNIKRASNG